MPRNESSTWRIKCAEETCRFLASVLNASRSATVRNTLVLINRDPRFDIATPLKKAICISIIERLVIFLFRSAATAKSFWRSTEKYLAITIRGMRKKVTNLSIVEAHVYEYFNHIRAGSVARKPSG